MSKSQILPDPHSSVLGSANVEGGRGESIADKAVYWAPKNVSNEKPSCTVSRYALRLIDRLTGQAYTVDELTPALVSSGITWTATTSAADSLAIPITHRSVNKTTGADAEALTLADGAFLGQRLNINLVTDGGGDGTLTPTTASGFATIVFADAGDFAELEWTTAGWRIIGIGGLTAQPTVTV